MDVSSYRGQRSEPTPVNQKAWATKERTMFAITFINDVSGQIIIMDELTIEEYNEAITSFIANNITMDWHIMC